MTTEEYKNLNSSKSAPTPVETIYNIGNTTAKPTFLRDFSRPLVSRQTVNVSYQKEEPKPIPEKKEKPIDRMMNMVFGDELKYTNDTFVEETQIEFKYIGEAFRTYIIVQYKGSLWFIDKHAAHERMLYDKLKKEGVTEVQALLSPVSVTLSREEHRAVLENLDLLKENGFEVEEFGTVSVLVRAVPACLANNDVMFLMCDIAANLVKTGKAQTDVLDDLYHNIACRSAIKGGNTQSAAELEEFARNLLSNDDIMYCPHGRPVAFELKKSELEKQFGRAK